MLIKKSYDKSYFENPLYQSYTNSPRDKKRLDVVLQHKQSGQLLEIGSAEGHFLHVAQQYFQVEGIEYSEYAAQKATALLHIPITCGDIQTIFLKQHAYDVIIVFNILEHLRNPAAVVQKLYTSLKKGGILVGSVPHNFGIIGNIWTRTTNIIDKTHISTLPMTTWKKLFLETGFEKISCFGEIPLGRNNSIYLTNPLWEHISFNLMFVCEKK